MSKDRNTYLKVQREMEKRRKAEDKRARRQKRKEGANDPNDPDVASPSVTEE